MKKQTFSVILLIILSIIWGLGYIGVTDALNNSWGAFPILFLRTLIGAIIVFPFTIKKSYKSKRLFRKGLLIGVVSFLAYAFQTYGQSMTTVSATAFITSLYVIFIPLILRVVIRKKESSIIYLSSAIAIIGCVLLNLKLPLSFDTDNILGNVLVFIGMIFFAVQIILIGKYSNELDITQLTFIELVTISFMSLVSMSIIGDFSFHKEGLFNVIQVGVFSSGLCGLLQMYGQRNLSDSVSGIIMSLESLFGAIFAILFFKEYLSWIQWIGCALILIPVILCELYVKKEAKKEINDNL